MRVLQARDYLSQVMKQRIWITALLEVQNLRVKLTMQYALPLRLVRVPNAQHAAATPGSSETPFPPRDVVRGWFPLSSL
jgi:hypothetical protein